MKTNNSRNIFTESIKKIKIKKHATSIEMKYIYKNGNILKFTTSRDNIDRSDRITLPLSYGFINAIIDNERFKDFYETHTGIKITYN